MAAGDDRPAARLRGLKVSAHQYCRRRRRKEFMSRQSTTYEVIVVGAGTAGCVIVARLSEHSDATGGTMRHHRRDSADNSSGEGILGFSHCAADDLGGGQNVVDQSHGLTCELG